MTEARDVIIDAIGAHLDRIDFPKDVIVQDVSMSDAIIRALREAGFAVVPVEPTARMVDAGVEASDKQRVAPIYRAMVYAAQGGTDE